MRCENFYASAATAALRQWSSHVHCDAEPACVYWLCCARPLAAGIVHTIIDRNQRMPPSPSNVHVVRVAFASFIGTAIEFYDFYIYAMAAALVIGPVFFPGGDPATQSRLKSS